MKRSRFTEEQIIGVLREQEAGAATAEVWPAAGSEDTKLGVNMELEVDHGATEIYASDRPVFSGPVLMSDYAAF